MRSKGEWESKKRASWWQEDNMPQSQSKRLTWTPVIIGVSQFNVDDDNDEYGTRISAFSLSLSLSLSKYLTKMYSRKCLESLILFSFLPLVTVFCSFADALDSFVLLDIFVKGLRESIYGKYSNACIIWSFVTRGFVQHTRTYCNCNDTLFFRSLVAHAKQAFVLILFASNVNMLVRQMICVEQVKVEESSVSKDSN